MSVNGLQTELASASVPRAGGHAIPDELLLAIVDITLAESRNGNSTAARRFSCVSRALRAYTLPIIYEFLIITVPEVRRSSTWEPAAEPTPIVGHDGRIYEHRPLAFLSLLLHDPAAEPRKYVKYLGFRHREYFHAEDIGHICPFINPDTDLGDDLPRTYWDIDQLIVTSTQPVLHLQHVGIRAREVHLLMMLPPGFNYCTNRFFVEKMQPVSRTVDRIECARRHTRCWIFPQASHQTTADTKDQAAHPEPELCSSLEMAHRQLNEDDNSPRPSGEFFMIEVHNSNVMEDADACVDDMAELLRSDRRQHVVLVHALDDETDVEKVSKVLASAREKLPLDLRKRLRVSHTTWDPATLKRGHMRACFDLMRRGIDPWDVGHVPASLLSE